MDDGSPSQSPDVPDPLVETLRDAGCVFAEEEARILRAAASTRAQLAELAEARVSGRPLEQLVGWVDFRGLRLRVGPGVFVPRQRTLLLADTAIEALADSAHPVFVEAFAGVAPVAAAVCAALPHTTIHVTERQEAALAHARRNLPAEAGVHRGDVLDPLPETLRGRVDVIAAVPPYVPSGAADLLPREARDFEPAQALFGGDDGLDPARSLIARAGRWLAPTGRLLLELNEAQLGAATAAGRLAGFGARLHVSPDGQTAVLELAPR